MQSNNPVTEQIAPISRCLGYIFPKHKQKHDSKFPMVLNSDNVEARASIKNLDNQSSTITTLRQQDMKDKKLLQGQRLRQKSYEQRKYFSYTMNEQWYIKPSTHMR